MQKFIVDEVEYVVKKEMGVVVGKVVKQVEEQLSTGHLKSIFLSTITECAPEIAKAAAISALKCVPLKVVDSQAMQMFPGLGNTSVGEAVVTMKRDQSVFKDEVRMGLSMLKVELRQMHAILGELINPQVADLSEPLNKLEKMCVVCAEPATKKCGKCNMINYCSKECQKSHWKLHKGFCYEK